jgi:solute carrier family 8 (sodium/calcium exchanger)
MLNTYVFCFQGLKKKLLAISKLRGCEDLSPWIRSIVNHLYWSASSTPDGNGDMILAKWMSLQNHILGVHSGHSDLFPACAHEPITENESRKKWLKPCTLFTVWNKSTRCNCALIAATPAYEKFAMLANSRQVKKDVPMLSNDQQTSQNEAYHSVTNHFCPKMIGFSYHGMESR